MNCYGGDASIDRNGAGKTAITLETLYKLFPVSYTLSHVYWIPIRCKFHI